MSDTTRIVALIGFLVLVAPAILYAMRNRRAAARNGLIWLIVVAVLSAAYVLLAMG